MHSINLIINFIEFHWLQFTFFIKYAKFNKIELYDHISDKSVIIVAIKSIF